MHISHRAVAKSGETVPSCCPVLETIWLKGVTLRLSMSAATRGNAPRDRVNEKGGHKSHSPEVPALSAKHDLHRSGSRGTWVRLWESTFHCELAH